MRPSKPVRNLARRCTTQLSLSCKPQELSTGFFSFARSSPQVLHRLIGLLIRNSMLTQFLDVSKTWEAWFIRTSSNTVNHMDGSLHSMLGRHLYLQARALVRLDRLWRKDAAKRAERWSSNQSQRLGLGQWQWRGAVPDPNNQVYILSVMHKIIYKHTIHKMGQGWWMNVNDKI